MRLLRRRFRLNLVLDSLWRQEEGVLPVVQILFPGHTERDALLVRAVELVGVVVRVEVGCDVRLLHLLFTVLLLTDV